jgi:hypothetical protein
MFLTYGVVYKVMEKIGKLTEARMVIPEEPKMYPLISDKNFKGTLVAERRMKKRSKLEEEELAGKLPKDKPTSMRDMTTNSPRRATPKSVQVGGPYDLTAEAKKEKAAMKEGSMGMKRLGRVEKGIEQKRNVARDKSWSPDQATRDQAFSDMDKLRKRANRVAFRQGYQDSARARRAANTGGDPRNNNSENS